MSYKSKSIKKVIEEIDHNKIYLPALQRKFVWGKQQIQLLFDSLMRNYPIGTFLFWNLHKNTAENYVFYEFLKEYDERQPFNRRKTGSFTHEEIIGVLDGQQRLSSMYIGLMGTHSEKARYRRVNDDSAYQKMCLYLNLLSLPYIINEQDKIEMLEDRNFEFRFLTPEDARLNVARKVSQEQNGSDEIEQVYWLRVGDVLAWDDDFECDHLVEKLADNCKTEAQRKSLLEQKRFVKKCLELLHRRICKEPLLNYFEITKDDLEDILKIFIRVNSGGTILSKTDLLFSTIVATWDDGREQIEELLKTINDKGDKFNFGNEYLMRCCLMLTDASVAFKVNSFKSDNVQKIQTEWPKIAAAIKKTVGLLAEFGFNGSLLTSQNSTIIIAYYIYKGGDLGQESKTGIRKYLIHALLNRIYSGSQDQLLSSLRNAFRMEAKSATGGTDYQLKQSKFSFDDLLKVVLPGRKSLAVTETDIDLFLAIKKGPESFFVLSLLYPHMRYQDQVFHQDHIHPYAHFTTSNLQALGIEQEAIAQWIECRDCVPNLQLLNGRENVSKNASLLVNWMSKMKPDEQRAFRMDNYFPEDVGLEFMHFSEFFQRRKERLRNALKTVLSVSNQQHIALPEPWENNEELDEIEMKVA